jgi:murein L,D-transpeptidase YcbB/YkuD
MPIDRRKLMRAWLALTIVMSLATAAFAVDIKNGATADVKAHSIWFQDDAQLARWQQLKQAGDAKALARYQDRLLSTRHAWQFDNALTVRILRYEPDQHRVKVEMTTEGRMKGAKWSIDPDALMP